MKAVVKNVGIMCFGVVCVLAVLATGCTREPVETEPVLSLAEARSGFKTVLVAQAVPKERVEKAPSDIFRTIKYPAVHGELAAYLSPGPGDGTKRPAIIWIVGGDCNSIGDVWSPAERANDQTAAAFRKAGVVMMFPSLRGGNDNPGAREGFLGEVDDILAAASYLEKQAYVDPKRIYLGGHSTGGTLALLVAEVSDRFRAVFSFGPVDNIAGYGAESGFLPFNLSNRKEVKLRSPGYWLHCVQTPTWVFEGEHQSNIRSLRTMAKASKNPKAHFIPVKGGDHFSILAPVNELIATKILQDTGEVSRIDFSEGEVNEVFGRGLR